MPTITAIRRSKGRRLSIYLDGALAASLDADTVAEADLAIGLELSPAALEALLQTDAARRCYAAGLRLLGFRPRSEAELRRRLGRAYQRDALESTLMRLRQEGLVDDEAFAAYWREQRQAFGPRSGRLIQAELRAKGVPPTVAGAAAEAVDDDEAAYRAGQKRAQRLAGEDYDAFAQRLGDFLLRRGFSYEVAHGAVQRLWREQRGEPEP